ncbi:MAG: penicillin-binding protein 2 [Actinobacteria bacterium]|nr:MAG: penicillin-binding protein 2 [Actinomycetota bacterium]
MKRPPVHRLVVLLLTVVLAIGGVVVRLAVLQVRESGTYAELGSTQRVHTEPLPSLRGEMLDRTGVPMALTLDARDVYANPSLVVDAATEAGQIAPVLGLKEKDVRAALSSPGTFAYVERQVDFDIAQHVADLHLPGIGLLPVVKRYYPAGPVAPQVLGFVNVDGVGTTGLERQYDQLLAGSPGERTVELSAQGQEIGGGRQIVQDPQPGSSVVLTIDRDLQFQAQQYLQKAVRQNHAKGGTIVVLDPHTGDVYAMASYPWFDPNSFASFDPTRFVNRAVTDTWEPGSVNKTITAAAALESGAVTPTERFAVPGTRRVEGYTIHDAEPHGRETMTLGDIIAHSSNVGASLVADRTGNRTMEETFARFGYGTPTGIGFPGEAAGLMPAAPWSDLTRATVSFGAGVAVTPLQMASVYATIANGGTWVQPRLVDATIGPDGVRNDAPPPVTRRVLRPSTTQTLTEMLAYVVQDGTGVSAQIPGYQVAGKTGTAKKLDANGHYVSRYVASFIGFLPASRPRVVVAVIIDEPRTVYGGVAAAPVFQQVARYAIQRLGIEAAPAVPLPPHAMPVP